MKESKKLTSSKTVLMDLVLTGIFFVIMTALLRPFVPADEPFYVWFLAAFTALPLTGVFWLASQMFRVTLVDQLRRQKDSKEA